MNNYSYYDSLNISQQINIKILDFDDNNDVLEILYYPKHSVGPIIIKREKVNKDTGIMNYILWLLEEYKDSDYSELIDNPEDYKHLKKSVVKQPEMPLYDTLDGEYIYESETI